MARAEKLRRQIEAFTEPARRLAAEFGLEEEDEDAAPLSQPADVVQAAAHTPKPEPQPASRPAFEVEPGKALLVTMRQAFPGFKPTDRWWFHAERELKNAHHRSNAEGHEAFCAAYQNWSAEDLIHHLEAEGLIPSQPKGGRKHKRTVEGLNVNEWVAAMAARDPSFRYLSQRAAAELGPFSASGIGICELWIQMKTMVQNEALEAAERAKAELEDRRGEDEDVGGFRRSSTKHGVGIQRPTAGDLKDEREAAAFLRSKSGQTHKKRAK
jgi:hypothetical protein